MRRLEQAGPDQRPRGEEQRIAGEEGAEEEPGLGEDDGEEDDEAAPLDQVLKAFAVERIKELVQEIHRLRGRGRRGAVTRYPIEHRREAATDFTDYADWADWNERRLRVLAPTDR